MGEKRRNTYRVLLERSVPKRALGWPYHRQEDSIEVGQKVGLD
jgi:hypothetical protein